MIFSIVRSRIYFPLYCICIREWCVQHFQPYQLNICTIYSHFTVEYNCPGILPTCNWKPSDVHDGQYEMKYYTTPYPMSFILLMKGFVYLEWCGMSIIVWFYVFSPKIGSEGGYREGAILNRLHRGQYLVLERVRVHSILLKWYTNGSCNKKWGLENFYYGLKKQGLRGLAAVVSLSVVVCWVILPWEN